MFWNVCIICVDIKTIPGPNPPSISHDIGPYNRHVTIIMVGDPIHAQSILIYWLLIHRTRPIIDFNRSMPVPTIKEQEQRIVIEEEDNIDNKVVETIETGKVFIGEKEEVVEGEEY